MSNARAIKPYRFVCAACGKTSATKYGLGDDDKDRGWDESCMLKSVLCERNPRYEADPASEPPWRVIETPIKGTHYEDVA